VVAACATGLSALGGCGGSGSRTDVNVEPKQLLRVVSIKASDAGNGEPALQHLIAAPSGPNEVFFETTAHFPHQFTLDLDPSETRSLRTYVLGTGNHGDHGNDSILRMPRGWILSGSDDGTNWTVLDRQKVSTPWRPNEDRRFNLSSPSRHKHFRFELTESGVQPILRVYGIRLYAD
jgi:hypothetical protein